MLGSAYSEYKLNRAIIEFEDTVQEVDRKGKALFKEALKIRKDIDQYEASLISKINQKELVIFLDSLRSSKIPDTILSIKTLESLKIVGSKKDIKKGKKNNILSIKEKGFRLEQIPLKINNLVNLKKLDFSNNNINKIPTSIYGLKKLEYLNVANNKLSKDEILKLENKIPVNCKLIVKE